MTMTKPIKERSFKGLSPSERKTIRYEKLIQAGIKIYGTRGFFATTVKDICLEAQLTERYFYESFKKSEQLFQTVFLQLIDELQNNIKNASIPYTHQPKKMIEASLDALLTTLYNNPNMARIIYIDAILVQELHKQTTIQETMARFDRMLHPLLITTNLNNERNKHEVSLITSGLNGYVTQIAILWVMNNFQQPKATVLSACLCPFLPLFNENSN